MTIKIKIVISLASLLAVAIALFDLWLWQPERQLMRHHAHFLHAAETRNWPRFASFIAPGYSDRWKHDKTFVVRESSEVLRQFFVLTISDEMLSCEITGNHARVTARLKFDGTGTAIAENAKQEVNRLQTPFVFEWTRQSWKPWDWQLTRADNAQLELSDWAD